MLGLKISHTLRRNKGANKLWWLRPTRVVVFMVGIVVEIWNVSLSFERFRWFSAEQMGVKAKSKGNWNKSVFQHSKIQQYRLIWSCRASFAAPLPFNTPPHCYFKYIENLEICQRQGPCPPPNAEASPAREHPAQHFPITAGQSANYCPLLQSQDYDSPF